MKEVGLEILRVTGYTRDKEGESNTIHNVHTKRV